MIKNNAECTQRNKVLCYIKDVMIKKSKSYHQLNDQRTLCEWDKRSDKRATEIWDLRLWDAVVIRKITHIKITISHE